MARHAPADHFVDDDPTVYIHYDEDGPGAQPQPDDPIPGWRKPAALIGWGLLIAVLIALIVWGVMQLVAGTPPQDTFIRTPTTATTSRLPTSAATPVTPAPAPSLTTEPMPSSDAPTASTEETPPSTTPQSTATTTPSGEAYPLPQLPSVITLPSLPGLPTEITLPPGL
ncbi:oligopeptide transporter substrate-binding protein [Mycobacterium sherrisii]|uniref:oligopeptide transporter substrate-binding protein n=1 Tax=Mycobacterium sherrisii TaxID=243061 RepID=UPI00115442A7|nr:oligopeptide transporter substrate-binding protein [Mycobacterium sherrisii]MCV7028459.1 oligopeptide transporter substrate-binding protein [Mycobacterium sherrisii]